jgi:hypothetical protein
MVTTRGNTKSMPPRTRKPTEKASKTAPAPKPPIKQPKSKKPPPPKPKSTAKRGAKELLKAQFDVIPVYSSPSPRVSSPVEPVEEPLIPPEAPSFIVLVSFDVTIDGEHEYGVGFDIDLSKADRPDWDRLMGEVTSSFMEVIKGRVFNPPLRAPQWWKAKYGPQKERKGYHIRVEVGRYDWGRFEGVLRVSANKTAEVSIEYGCLYPPGQAPNPKAIGSATRAKAVVKRPYQETETDPFASSPGVSNGGKKPRVTSTSLLLDAHHETVSSQHGTLVGYQRRVHEYYLCKDPDSKHPTMPCWTPPLGDKHFIMSGLDTELWAQKWMEGTTNLLQPPAALMTLFKERAKAESEALRSKKKAEKQPIVQSVAAAVIPQVGQQMVPQIAPQAPPQEPIYSLPHAGYPAQIPYFLEPRRSYAPPLPWRQQQQYHEPGNPYVRPQMRHEPPPFELSSDGWTDYTRGDMIRTDFRSMGSYPPQRRHHQHQRYDQDGLPILPRYQESNSTSMPSYRMSSPLRSDIPIAQQLEDFLLWLKKNLPRNRQARLDDIFVQFQADETMIEDIRTLSAQDARDKSIPKSTLDEIKKLISPFTAWYKPQIVRREQEEQARALLSIRNSSTAGGSGRITEIDHQDDEQYDDEVQYRDSQPAYPGQGEFDDEVEG